MRLSPVQFLVASVTLIGTATTTSAWEAEEFDARAVGGAFNPVDEFVAREFAYPTYERDLGDEEAHFYAREWEDADDMFLSRSLFGDDELDMFERSDILDDWEDYSLRDLGVEENEEMFARNMADMDQASEFALRGFVGEDDGLAEVVMREMEEDEAYMARRQQQKQKTLSGMTPPAAPAPSAAPSSPEAPGTETIGGPPKIHWKLAPVNCKAVTKYLHTYHKVRSSYKRWQGRLANAKTKGDAKLVASAEARLKERKEFQKRLVLALLMQGRVLN